MASRSLGQLTYDVIAKIGGFTAGMTEAERQADKSAKEIQKRIESIGVTGYAVGNALGQYLKEGIDLAIGAFPRLIEQAAQFADIADMTGGSAEGFANFAVSAKVAGVGMDEIAAASVRLTKSLVGVDDESKAAGAALAALGINIEDFKSLRPDQQIEAVSKALGGFADGAGKTAVAMDLFGKSGANVLKFLKDYEEAGGAVNILTAEQIKRADEYGDAQSRARAQLDLYVTAAATEFIPILTALMTVAKDLIKEFTGLGEESTKLGNNNGVQTFAENAVNYLGTVLDAVQIVGRGFTILGTGIGATAATASALLDRNFKGALEIQVQGAKDMYDQTVQIGDNLISGRIKKAIADQKALARQAAIENRGFTPGQQQLDYRGRQTGGARGRTDNSAAQEAKAQLAADLSDIKAAQDALINSYTNAGKILEAERAAGLKDEEEYYAEKKRLLIASNDAEQSGLQQQIARLQQENLAGKDAIENNRKIAEAQAKLTKAREDGATAVQVLAIQEESAYKKIASALLAARQAAQDYYDTTNRGYERMLSALGQGNKQRDYLAGVQQIEDRYQQQRQDLANRRSQAELLAGGTLTAQAAKQFDDQLEIINEFQAKAVASYQSYYGRLDAAQKDWSIGATEALRNYADEAANTAKQTEEVFGDAFKGLEDALVDFVKTGKLDFKSLADSIIADIARIAIKQAVTGPLANWMSGLIGGASGGVSSGGGDALGALISMNGWASGGFTGYGNPTEPAGIVHKGEWVIPADQVRQIGVDNLRSGRVGGAVTNINVTVPHMVDNRTRSQMAQDIAVQQRNARRFD